jgi:hypothetical protein
MINPGDVISYIDMCQEEEENLQRGMNFRKHGKTSVILMSLRQGAPYADKIEDDGRVLIYEGHDIPAKKNGPDPKTIDQPQSSPKGSLTQNGLFYNAAQQYKANQSPPKLVKVYEKIHPGIWVYNGIFKLVDAWKELCYKRNVFKFKLEISDYTEGTLLNEKDLDHSRLIPSSVKLEVWNRDGGKCVLCQRNDNLHFDHIIPFSKGGSSLSAKNVQLLCARHNLEKRDKIE